VVKKGGDRRGYKEARVLIEKGRVVLFTELSVRSPQQERIGNSLKALIGKGILTYPEYPHP